jgi:hypothetical protein
MSPDLQLTRHPGAAALRLVNPILALFGLQNGLDRLETLPAHRLSRALEHPEAPADHRLPVATPRNPLPKPPCRCYRVHHEHEDVQQ